MRKTREYDHHRALCEVSRRIQGWFRLESPRVIYSWPHADHLGSVRLGFAGLRRDQSSIPTGRQQPSDGS